MERNTIQEMREILDAIEAGKPEEPKNKWRPFKNVDEFIKAAGGLGAIWLKCKTTYLTLFVIGIDNKDKDRPIRVGTCWESFDKLLEYYTFADGTPCGVEEDA